MRSAALDDDLLDGDDHLVEHGDDDAQGNDDIVDDDHQHAPCRGVVRDRSGRR